MEFDYVCFIRNDSHDIYDNEMLNREFECEG